MTIDRSNCKVHLQTMHVDNATRLFYGLLLFFFTNSEVSAPTTSNKSAFTPDPPHLQSYAEGQLGVVAAPLLAGTDIGRQLSTINANHRLMPAQTHLMPSKTPASQATATVTPSRKQSECIRCDKKIPKPQSLCTTSHKDGVPPAEILDKDLCNIIPRLYSHLCKAAAVVSVILPRQGREDNESYIGRLLKEAEKTEAAGKKKKVEAATAKAAKSIQKLTKTSGAESATHHNDPEGNEDSTYGGDFWTDTDSDVLVDSEGEPYVDDEMEDLEYSDCDDSGRETGLGRRARMMLEDEGVERCPVCDWKLKKDRCMRCGYLVGDDMDEKSSEDDEDSLSAMLDQLIYRR